MRRNLAAGTLILALACTLFAGAGEKMPPALTLPEAGQGRLIVSPRSYWRHYYVFRPAQSYFPKEKKLQPLPERYGAKGTAPIVNLLRTPDAPADWAALGFEDSGWPVARAPLPWLPEMDQDGEGPYSCHAIRKAYGRTRFLVPDPSKVTKLTLRVAYHGGVAVYVNGKQIGAGHLAAGDPLAAEGFAEPYPEEAYRETDPAADSRKRGWGWWHPSMPYHRWRHEDKPEVVAQFDRVAKARERTLEIAVPRETLVKGVNLLAVENRLCPVLMLEGPRHKAVSQYYGKIPHIGITDIGLAAEPDGAVLSADHRPAGVQAWARDIHQWTLEEDYLEPGVEPSKVLRMLAPRNGACSAQIVFGADRALAKPSAQVSELAGPGDAKIPASAVQIRYAQGFPIAGVKGKYRISFFAYMPDRWLIRYKGAPVDTWVAEWTDHHGKGRLLGELWKKDTMRLNDRLSSQPPAEFPASTSTPVWLTVEVPPDAAPGLYTGTLSVQATDLPPAVFQMRVQVMDFALPEPKAFTAYAGIDESPWALAQWAGVKLWSDEHWKLVEQSVRWAGKLGARVAGIPVVHKTELNNEEDTMVKWVKKPDGGYDFDFTLADRYLALWRKYGHKDSDVIVYLVHPADVYGKGGGTGTVTLLDPSTGESSAWDPPQPDTPEGEKLWTACAQAAKAHFNNLGFGDAHIHWGLFYDYIGQKSFALAEPLAKAIPTIGWARSSHEGRGIHGGHAVKVTWNAAVRAEQRAPFAKDGMVKSHKGWSNPEARLLLPRADSDVNALSVLPPLWQLREVQEMPVTGMYRGFARVCVDGWGRGTYFGPFNPWLLYPADGHMDSSIQFEILREGLQETEARIFLEKQASLPPAVQKVLDERTQRVWMIPPRPEAQRIGEYWAGWQESSWELYAAAAAVAGGKAPSSSEKAAFFGPSKKK